MRGSEDQGWGMWNIEMCPTDHIAKGFSIWVRFFNQISINISILKIDQSEGTKFQLIFLYLKIDQSEGIKIQLEFLY